MSSGGIPPLSYNRLGIKLSPFVLALHKDLMERRNKIFAHSDIERVEYSLPVVVQGKNSQGEPFTTLFPPRFREGTLFDEAKFEQVSVLVACASHAVMHMLQAMHIHFQDRYPSE